MKLPLVIVTSSLVLTGSFSTVLTAAPGGTAPAAQTGQGAPAHLGWPREATLQGVHLTVYQPQVDAWEDSRRLKARAAFVMTPGKGKPVVGIMELVGKTTTNLETRTVFIADLKLTALRFPSLPEAEVPPTEAAFRKAFPSHSMTVSLDRLIAGLEHHAKPLTLKMDPPRIVTSEGPALLLLVEGKPVLAPAGKGEFVVNANWDLFLDAGTYYLLGGKTWYSSKTLDGEWSLASGVPEFLSSLPEGDQWDHVKKSIPPKVERGQEVARVVFSDQPAELIVFDGAPVWEEVKGTELLWARNTQRWVFRLGKEVYFLTSGRWFRAPDLSGPWSYAGNDLPNAFGRIPHDSPCAEVLASVPGTPEASDAILLASIPREAVVKVKEAQAKARVAYTGEPAFEPIEGTTMAYATNTGSDVIRVEGRYYLCQDGVWFMAPAPAGPWTICVQVPTVIYTIPVSCPVHRVVYVKMEPGASADVVVCSYTAGYEGAYVAGVATGAVLVWGTGYYYPPYVAWGGAVPVYYPWPATYGTAAVYNSWTGGYAVGGRYYGPYGSAGQAAWYNPATGNYGRAARVTTPYGSSTWAAGYNPRTDTAWSTNQNYNGYSQWGSSAVSRGDDWLRTGHVVNDNGGAVAWRGSEGGGHAWKTDDHSGGMAYHDGDFYAGHDGNVYKRDDNGDWSKYDDGNWESVDGPQRGENANSNNLQSSANEAGDRTRGEGEGRAGQEQARSQTQNGAQQPEGDRSRRGETPASQEGAAQQRRTAGEETAPGGSQRENAADRNTARQGADGSRRDATTQPQRRTSENAGERPARQGGERQRPSSREGGSGRQLSQDLSRQLNRDASNRRSGIDREQRSFERRGSGGGERFQRGGGGERRGGGRR
ncbi:MAG TPA: hypothetical protein VNQ90_06805 [Chthoniobacteraceae bacterium]|nr:hypothetical protein [Chthoniobacteraceae bacterium]